MMPECPRVGMLWLGPETLREDRPPAARDFNMYHVTKCSQPPSEDVTPNVRMQKLRLRMVKSHGKGSSPKSWPSWIVRLHLVAKDTPFLSTVWILDLATYGVLWRLVVEM